MTLDADREVRVSVFGGLRVWRGPYEVDAGPPRQRIVLALLVAAGGRAVAMTDLVDAVWPTDPPASAVNQLHRLVGQIRRTFEPTLLPHAAGRLVLAAGAGYRLAMESVDSDLLRFRELTRQADECVHAGDAVRACQVYADALARSEGKVFAGLESRILLRPEVTSLERERESVIVAAANAAVDAGVIPSPIVAAVQRAASEAPLNETLCAALLRLLAAAGRRAEALAAYEVVRRALAEELGVDPGSQLTAVFQELLVEQPYAVPISPGDDVDGAGPARDHRRPAQIPRPVAGFVERSDRSAELPEVGDGAAGPIVVTAIGGMAGIGKTALAMHWAHELADRFPDGQLYINLRGFDPSGNLLDPADALAQLLESLGETPKADSRDDVDARAARYRTLIAERRMIIVLDNARDSTQVRPLLPGSKDSLVLVTSRNRLTSLAAREGARFVELDRLNASDARTLLANRLGPVRIAAEPAALERSVAACHGLPLALAIAAGRIATEPGRPLSDFADELTDPHLRLDALSTGEPGDDLRTVLSWSYRALSPEAARLLRHLAAHPGPETSSAALASMTGLTRTRTEQLARELVNASLGSESGRTEVGGRRYVLHDLVRAYAGELLDTADERDDAEQRLIEHYVASTRAAYLQFGRRPLVPAAPVTAHVTAETPSGVEASLAWFSDERSVLVAVVDLALRRGQPLLAALIVLDRRPMDHTLDALADPLPQCLRVLERVDESVPALVVAELHRDVATRYGQAPESDAHRERALELYRQLNDLSGQANLYRNLAKFEWSREQYDSAHEHARQAVIVARRCDEPAILAAALTILSSAEISTGRFAAAISSSEEAWRIFRAQSMPHEEAVAVQAIGEAWFELGNPEKALRYLDMALELAGVTIYRDEALVQALRAHAALQLGDRDLAASAVARFTEIVAGDGQAKVVALGFPSAELDRAARRVELVRRALE